jgi:WD40 repeat protein
MQKKDKDTPLQAYRGEVLDLAFSPDGKGLVASTSSRWPDGTLTIWDPKTGDKVKTLQSHKDLVFAIAFAPKGNIMATAGFDGALKLWDTATWEETASWKVRLGVVQLRFTKDGEHLLLGGSNGIELRGIKGAKLVRTFPDNGYGRFSLSPDDKELVTAGEETIRFWDYVTGKEVATIPALSTKDRAGIFDVSHSPDGKQLVSLGVDRIVRLWDTTTRKQLAQVGSLIDRPNRVAFSPDGSIVAVAAGQGQPRSERDQPGEIYLWKMNGNKPFEQKIEVERHEFGVLALAFSPDSKLLATGSKSEKGRIAILDVAKELKAKPGD